MVILVDEEETAITKLVVDLPTNKDMITKVYNTTKTDQFTEIRKFKINEICVVVWFISSGHMHGFFGFINADDSSGYMD